MITMYTLNLLAFDPHCLLNSAHFDTYLKQLPLRVTRIQADSFLQGHALPRADINLFLCSNHLLDQTEPYQKLCNFLSSASPGINLCLIPDGDALNNELVSQFHDFLLWPCSITEFNTRLTRLLRLQQNPVTDHNQLLAEFAALNLIGKSPRFVANVQLIKKMSTCHAAVLIQGETGTGKENAARAIHYLSKRSEQGFVPVNCAAIPDELLESELFGHEKGAFTDAKQTQAGLVAIANGGTLFLDEVDSLTPKAQAALLRFLQTQEYRPLGAKQTQLADVRILAATNADLKTLVANKQFREDLYFRLNVLNLTMPPLRERLNDISLIADSLLHRFALE
jgi:DNA-binding NtrC family response regulator